MSTIDDGYSAEFTKHHRAVGWVMVAVFLPLVVVLWIGILSH
jgi:hypothetical protein